MLFSMFAGIIDTSKQNVNQQPKWKSVNCFPWSFILSENRRIQEVLFYLVYSLPDFGAMFKLSAIYIIKHVEHKND